MPNNKATTTGHEAPRRPNIAERTTAISTVFLVLVGVGGLIFADVQVHELREEASVQHLLDRLHDFDSPRFTEIRKGLAFKRMDRSQERLRPLDENDPPIEMQDELNFCVDLGLLVKHGALDQHDVWSEFGYWLFPLYADAQPLLKDEQKDSPASYRECSDLMERIAPIEKQEDASAEDNPSEQDIYAYYLGESTAQPGEPGHLRKRSK